MSRVKRLTEALLADRSRGETDRNDITKCFMCRTGMMYRGSRFCSDRCRNFYDAGEPEQDWLHRPKPENLPLTELKVIAGPPGIELGACCHRLLFGDRPVTPMKRTAGNMIRCAGCGQEFDSKGLRCCSTDCERRYKERQENFATMAKAGIEPAPKRRCTNPDCANTIPKWTNGKRTPSSRRFCGPKCAQRARRASGSLNGVLTPGT